MLAAAPRRGLRETIVEGDTGWSYSVGNSAARAGAVKAVLAGRPRCGAARGRAQVRERFEQERVFARSASILEAGGPSP